MPKTPEEVKRGLAMCAFDDPCECENCPYFEPSARPEDCMTKLVRDAFELIHRLEGKNAENAARD